MHRSRTRKRRKGTDVNVRREKEDLSTAAVIDLGPCQVRSKTDRPCLRPAQVKIRGIPYCGQCAREQEAYFAIVELTQEGQALSNEPLVETLDSMRRARTVRVADAWIVTLGALE